MPITKEQWVQIECELSHAYGSVKLKCDGYEVSLQVSRVDTLKYGIMVYVNGYFHGKWIVEDCEERRRFLRPIECFLWNAKMRADLLKIYGGKRAPKKEVERINQKIASYISYWTSVKSLRRHLEKNNRELEVVAVGSMGLVGETDPEIELTAA